MDPTLIFFISVLIGFGFTAVGMFLAVEITDNPSLGVVFVGWLIGLAVAIPTVLALSYFTS